MGKAQGKTSLLQTQLRVLWRTGNSIAWRFSWATEQVEGSLGVTDGQFSPADIWMLGWDSWNHDTLKICLLFFLPFPFAGRCGFPPGAGRMWAFHILAQLETAGGNWTWTRTGNSKSYSHKQSQLHSESEYRQHQWLLRLAKTGFSAAPALSSMQEEGVSFLSKRCADRVVEGS